MTFALHPRLAADTLQGIELRLCTVRLMNDSRFPWLILVPRRADIVEIFDLTSSERTQLMEETASVAQALQQITGALKMNVAAIGNIVPQLHVHVVGRSEDDAAWPAPVWGFGTARPYADAESQTFRDALSTAFA